MSNEVEQRVLTMTDKRNLEKELEELRQAKLDVAEEIKIARGPRRPQRECRIR